MPNLYISVDAFKAALGMQNGGGAIDERDAAFARHLEAVSRGIDRFCERHFYSVSGVRYCNADGHQLHLGVDGVHHGFMAGFDIVSLSAIAVDNGAGVWSTTPLVEGTDFHLYPFNRPEHTPALFVLNARYSTVQSAVFPTFVRGTRLTGIFGYSDERELVTTTTEALDNSETGVDFTVAEPLVSVGDTLIIDSEQMYVSAVQGGTLTVQRAQNGTTAATHLAAASVYRRRYERDCEEATTLQAVRFWREKQTGGAGTAGGEFGGGFSSLYPAIKEMLLRLKFPSGY